MNEAVETFWFVVVAIGALILGLAIAYGLIRYTRRDRRKDAVTEASTKALYDSIDSGQLGESSDAPSDRPTEVKEGRKVPNYGR